MTITVGEVYKVDKGYVDWVRTHIGPNSSLEMQKLAVYIQNRDGRKSKTERIRQQAVSQQPKIQMMSSAAVKPLPRNVPKSMKVRNQPEATEGMMMVEQWDFVDIPAETLGVTGPMAASKSPEHQQMMQRAWAHFVSNLRTQNKIEIVEMKRHIENMDKDMLAKFLMNMAKN